MYTPVNYHSHGKCTILMVFTRKDGDFPWQAVCFREGTAMFGGVKLPKQLFVGVPTWTFLVSSSDCQ